VAHGGPVTAKPWERAPSWPRLAAHGGQFPPGSGRPGRPHTGASPRGSKPGTGPGRTGASSTNSVASAHWPGRGARSSPSLCAGPLTGRSPTDRGQNGRHPGLRAAARSGFGKIRVLALVEGALPTGMLLLADRSSSGFPPDSQPRRRAPTCCGRSRAPWCCRCARSWKTPLPRPDKGRARYSRGDPQAGGVRAGGGTGDDGGLPGRHHRPELYRFAATPLNEVACPARETAVWYARRWEIESTEGPRRPRRGHPALCGPVPALTRPARPGAGDPRLRDDTSAVGIFQGRPRLSATSNPGVPCTEVRPVVAHSIIERTGVDADCAAGEAARMTQGRHAPPPPGRTGPPAQLPPQP
jgi:hypothetical protein